MKKGLIYGIIGLASGFLNGILGAGGGTVIVPALERLLDVPPHKAHATAISIILPISIVSALFYLQKAMFDIKPMLIISVAGVIGGIYGAKALKKLSGRTIRTAFAISMIIVGIRMLWT